MLYWREISPLAVPILLENACVLLMGVLSTFLVSWLGKEAMAGVGLADSFNMVIMSFFAAIDLGTTVVVAFSLGKRDRKTGEGGCAAIAGDHDLVLDRAGGGYSRLWPADYRYRCRRRHGSG